MDKIKNPIFLENSIDPSNDKFVKKIFIKKISRKTGKEIWYMAWEYYKNRGNKSVKEIYKNNKGKEIKIIYRGDPVIHSFTIPLGKKPNDDDDDSLSISN